MKYTVKQVCQELGVTRRMLRFIEEKGLMDKASYENKGNGYREYSENDLDRIWVIKLLQGMGFSFDQIVEMTDNPDFDWFSALADKIKSMENEKLVIEKRIGYAKAMKLLGIIPYGLKEGETMTIRDFLEKAMDSLNVETDKEMKLVYDYIEQQKREQLARERDFLELTDPKLGIVSIKVSYYYVNIIENKDLGFTHSKIQGLVKEIYEIMHAYFLNDLGTEMSPLMFAKHTLPQFSGADVAFNNKQIFGENGCEFLANAIAYFAGYTNYEDIE